MAGGVASGGGFVGGELFWVDSKLKDLLNKGILKNAALTKNNILSDLVCFFGFPRRPVHPPAWAAAVRAPWRSAGSCCAARRRPWSPWRRRLQVPGRVGVEFGWLLFGPLLDVFDGLWWVFECFWSVFEMLFDHVLLLAGVLKTDGFLTRFHDGPLLRCFCPRAFDSTLARGTGSATWRSGRADVVRLTPPLLVFNALIPVYLSFS